MKVRNLVFVLSIAAAFAVRGEDLVYDVAEGETNTVGVINAGTANVDRIIKRGAGVLQFTSNVGYSRNFAAMVVEKGRVELSMGADGFCPTNVVIKTGAEVWNTGGKAVFVSTTSFDMEEGSLLYLGGVGDPIDGFRGYGVVSNKVDVQCSLSLNKGPYRFGGRVVGNPIFQCSDTSGSASSHKVLVLCSSNALANAQLRLGNGTATNLMFAAGIGEFYIGKLQCGDNSTGRSVVTHDESGAPIVVHAGKYSGGAGCPKLAGSGTYVLSSTSNGDAVFANTDFFDNFSGVFGCERNSAIIGYNDPAKQPDVSRPSGWFCIPDTVDASIQFYNRGCQTNFLKGVFRAWKANGKTSTLYFLGPTVVERFKTRTVAINLYSNLVMKSGILDMASNGFQCKNPGCSVDVEGGTISAYRTTTGSNHGWSKLRFMSPMAINSPHCMNYLRITGGGEVLLKDYVPSTVATEGGTLSLGGKFLPYSGATAAKPTTLFFDGGKFRIYGYNDSVGGVDVSDYSDSIKFAVGAGGMTLEMFADTQIWTDSYCFPTFKNPIVSGVELGTDGGITRIGGGHLRFLRPLTITGPFRALDGTLDILEAAAANMAASDAPFFGIGEFEMGNSVVRYNSDVATDFTLRLGTAGGFRTSGAATFRLKTNAARPVNIRLGALTRDRGSALFLYSDISGVSTFSPASSGIVSVDGGLETNDVGLVKAPVFLRTVPAGSSFGLMQFATYDGDNDRIDAFTGMTEGVVDGTVASVASAPVTIPSDTTVSVKALRVRGISGIHPGTTTGPLFLESGSVLNVGDGVNPACVILNNLNDNYGAGITGGGTLNFGASEGVIAVNKSYDSQLGVSVTGSGGISIVGPIDGGYNTLAVSGRNTYTGGTTINGVSVKFSGTSPFGSGKVRCGGGKVGGGRLWFTSAGTILANDLELSGYGQTRGDPGQLGAIVFTASGRAAGAIELKDKTRILAGNATTVGELSGPISGDMLQAWDYSICESGKVPGELVLSHANTYTGGTEIVRCNLTLKGEGTLGTGKVVLDGGTLVLDKDGDVTLENLVEGVGTIAVATRGVHTFTNLDSEDDMFTLGLLDKRCTVASLNGFSSVTNMTAKAVDLYVLDGSNENFKGEVYGVALHTGPCPAVGTMIIVR